MPKVIYNSTTIECAVALKGQDYVHLLDERNVMIAAFDGVIDFSIFTIQDGTWTAPAPDHDCPVAVVRPDGTIASCDSIARASMLTFKLPSASASWTADAKGYMKSFNVTGLNKNDVLHLLPSTECAWARGALTIEMLDGKVTFFAATLPTTDCIIYAYRISTSNAINMV